MEVGVKIAAEGISGTAVVIGDGKGLGEDVSQQFDEVVRVALADKLPKANLIVDCCNLTRLSASFLEQIEKMGTDRFLKEIEVPKREAHYAKLGEACQMGGRLVFAHAVSQEYKKPEKESCRQHSIAVWSLAMEGFVPLGQNMSWSKKGAVIRGGVFEKRQLFKNLARIVQQHKLLAALDDQITEDERAFDGGASFALRRLAAVDVGKHIHHKTFEDFRDALYEAVTL